MIDLSIKPRPSVRETLRAATNEVHERLHEHPRLKPLADGVIDRAAYRDLLARLYGFHAAADAAFEQADVQVPIDMAVRRKAPLLRADLLALGFSEDAIEALPLCTDLPAIDSAATLLGCAYVVEGSTLGGRTLAKMVAPLLGGDLAGRRFLLGYGDRHGAMWREFTEVLETVTDTERLVAAATATFATFERWMD